MSLVVFFHEIPPASICVDVLNTDQYGSGREDMLRGKLGMLSFDGSFWKPAELSAHLGQQ